MTMLSRTKVTYRLIHRLSNLTQSIQDHKRRTFSKSKLSNASIACIDLLLTNGPKSSGAIAKHIGLTTGATTLLIAKLEEEGFLRRKIDTDDRRKVIVHPVLKKLKQQSADIDTLKQQLISTLDSYSLEEIAIISDFLQKTEALYNGESIGG